MSCKYWNLTQSAALRETHILNILACVLALADTIDTGLATVDGRVWTYLLARIMLALNTTERH